jgi:hypothetical protein
MAQKNVWSDRVTLLPISASVPAARGFVRDLLIEHDLLYLVEDVRLVSSELATNAARHARTSFTVLLEGLIDSVRLTVTHDCVPRPVLTAVPVMATAGRGLNIVGYYSRDWGVGEERRNTKSVWASFDLRPTTGRQMSLLLSDEPQTAVETSTVPSKSKRLLTELLREVQASRARMRAVRSSGRPELVRVAQTHFVVALTQYVESLASLRLPVPYALRDELRIYGGTLPAENPSKPGRRW